MYRSIVIVGFAALFGTACSSGDADTADARAAYVAEIEAWRAGRMDRLRADSGYLNLAGLFWLQDGTSSFGSADDNDIQFPAAAAPHVGEFETTTDGVRMTVAKDADVRFDGAPVESILMHDDTTETPITVTSGRLAWGVVNRQGMIGVRLRDFDHPALEALPPIPHFDVDSGWRLEGELRLFAEPKVMNVGTVIEGLGYNPTSPGRIAFNIGGATYELDAYQSGERLFFVFADATSRGDTYPAGRFMYADWPGEDGKTMLDFNKSYNPPCVFGDFATCPVASPRNRLPIRIEAGEKYIPELYVGSLTSH
ncbi:MAG: DUF1684 domain-containing protein [Proteobacteria bacterium]|nr:DUF1684 domain-containing protein [Pseudomonadota bacterium]